MTDKPVILVTIKSVSAPRFSLRISTDYVWITSFRIGLFGFAAGPIVQEDNQAVGDDGVGNYGKPFVPSFTTLNIGLILLRRPS